MNSYTATDIKQFFEQFETHITHIIVAQTHLHTYNKSPKQVSLMATQAKNSLRHALNCFERQLYPNAANLPKRKPHLYRPLTLVTIEGARQTLDKAQTIHFNISLGNLPPSLSTEQVADSFRQCWVEQAGQADDIYTQAYDSSLGSTWLGYTLKEAQQDARKAWEIDGNWDVNNCWIPKLALRAE